MRPSSSSHLRGFAHRRLLVVGTALAFLAEDVEVDLLGVIFGVVIDAADVLPSVDALVEQCLARRDLPARESAQSRRQGPQQLDPALRSERPEAVLEELSLVEDPLLLDDFRERVLVAATVVLVVDLVVTGGPAAQAHDL